MAKYFGYFAGGFSFLGLSCAIRPDNGLGERRVGYESVGIIADPGNTEFLASQCRIHLHRHSLDRSFGPEPENKRRRSPLKIIRELVRRLIQLDVVRARRDQLARFGRQFGNHLFDVSHINGP